MHTRDVFPAAAKQPTAIDNSSCGKQDKSDISRVDRFQELMRAKDKLRLVAYSQYFEKLASENSVKSITDDAI